MKPVKRSVVFLFIAALTGCMSQIKTPAPSPVSIHIQANEQNVAFVQNTLNQLGYNAGPADGLIGKKTRTALCEFQAANALQESCVINSETILKLSQLSGQDLPEGIPMLTATDANQ